LNINVAKTKVCIFEKRKTTRHINIMINDEPIDYVDTFTYLGVKFSYTGDLKVAIKALSEQVLKAYLNLLSLFDRVKFDIKKQN
jgi:hypothetical protein